MAKVNETYLAG